jgi:hypothetical protein
LTRPLCHNDDNTKSFQKPGTLNIAGLFLLQKAADVKLFPFQATSVTFVPSSFMTKIFVLPTASSYLSNTIVFDAVCMFAEFELRINADAAKATQKIAVKVCRQYFKSELFIAILL